MICFSMYCKICFFESFIIAIITIIFDFKMYNILILIKRKHAFAEIGMIEGYLLVPSWTSAGFVNETDIISFCYELVLKNW